MNPSFGYQPYSLPSDDNVIMQPPMFSMTPGFAFAQTSAAVVPQKASSSSTGSSSACSSAQSLVAERKQLAPDYQPGPLDVICARGSAAAIHPGNLRFRKKIKEILPEYSACDNKLSKSLLVSKIVDSVRDFSPNGGFVKKFEDGVYYEVGDAAAREKTGQCVRDALHTKYKSSTKSKKPRRKELKAMKKKRQQQPQRQQSEQRQIQKNDLMIDARQAFPALSRNESNEIGLTSIFEARQAFPTLSRNESNEISLTSIFFHAMDEGLSLDSLPVQC